MINDKAIVLLSGGLDSATCLYWAKNQKYDIYALTLNYYDRWIREIESARQLSKNVNNLLGPNQTDDSLVDDLKNLISANEGSCRLLIHLKAENGSLQRIRASHICVTSTHEFLHKLRETFGEKNVWIS